MLRPIFPRELPRRSPLQICRIGLQDRHARSRFPHLPLKGELKEISPSLFTLFDIKYPHDAFRTIAIFNLQLLGCFVSLTYFWYTVQDVFFHVVFVGKRAGIQRFLGLKLLEVHYKYNTTQHS